MRWPFAVGCLLAPLPSFACDRIVGLRADYYETACARLEPQPLFCEDFDEASYDPRAVWNSTSSTPGTLAVDTAEYRSSPASLRTQSTSTTNGTINVAVFRTFSLTGQTFAGTLDLDLIVDQEDASSSAQAVLAQIGLESSTNAYWLQLVATSSGSGPLICSLNEVGAANAPNGVWTHAVSQTLVPGTWRHVTLAVTAPLAGGRGSASLSFDGVRVADAPMIDVPVQNYQQTIGVGIAWASTPSTGWTAHYDNIVFDGAAD
jgi:hypothetical protein